MENYLSDCVERLKPSATLAMSQKSAALRAEGIDIINMSVGEPDFPTPTPIKLAGKRAIDANITTYSPVPGYMPLRKAIVEKLQRENGLTYEPTQVVVSNGAKQAVSNAMMALLNPGDEVIIPAPYWVSYPQMVLMAGGTPVSVETPIELDFKMTPHQLEEAITERTKMLILCSPCNPTGTVYSQEELDALAEVLRRHPRVFVLSDEIYEHINYIGVRGSIVKSPGMQERAILINGVSKAYSMTGWRIGYMAAPEPLAKACSKLQGQYSSGPCSISQMAALEAYTGPQDTVKEMCKVFEERRNLIVALAGEIDGFEVNEPKGAFYLFPKCNSFFGMQYGGQPIDTADDFALFLLQEAHVATVGGNSFGAPDCIRLSYAVSEKDIVEAMRRIKTATQKLREENA